jgi:hypothetical protein
MKSPSSVAVVKGFDENNQVVIEASMPLDEYYDQPQELIDSSAFRKKARVRRVEGVLYGTRGKVTQRFSNTYSAEGKYLHGRIEHEDGTVTED